MSAQLGGRARLVGRSLMRRNMRRGLAKLQRRDGTTPGDVCRPLGFRQFGPLLPFLLGPVEQRQTGRLRLLCAGLGLFKPLPERPAGLSRPGLATAFPPGCRRCLDLGMAMTSRTFKSAGTLAHFPLRANCARPPSAFRARGKAAAGSGPPRPANGEASPSRSLGTGPTLPTASLHKWRHTVRRIDQVDRTQTGSRCRLRCQQALEPAARRGPAPIGVVGGTGPVKRQIGRRICCAASGR